jgi:serine/threonine-protein kinase
MDAPVQEGEILAGKYRVERVLGFGGMGVVVSAFHDDLEQRVAVKFLSAAAAERPDAAERFRREARSAAKIRSEHVARVLDVGTLDTGLPFMVMEYLEGNDLSDELRHGVLPIEQAADYMLQAIEALAEAHAHGIVHRDLKPGNLFLANRADGTRRVKVLDFGISKALGGSSSALEELSLTKTAALIGSPLYMAPEQMRSAKDVDTRADIWSLGAMLYEMLAGQPPFSGESVPQLCAALLHDEPAPLRPLRPEIPPGLEQAVLRCLAKNREQRFANVVELGRALLPYALPQSRVHVERAARVLKTGDLTLSGISPLTERNTSPGSDASASSVGPHAPLTGSALEPVRANSAAEPAVAAPVIHPTINAWGDTSGNAPARRKGALVAAGVVAALLAGGLAVLFARSDAPAEAKAASPSHAAAAEASPLPVNAKAPVTELRPQVAESPPPTAAPSASPSTTQAAPPAAAAAARPAARPNIAKPKAAAASLKSPAKAEPKPREGSGITDFGGRR